MVGSCTSPDQWAILQHRADESLVSSKAAMSVQHLERFSKEADPLSRSKGDALQMGAIELVFVEGDAKKFEDTNFFDG